MLKTLVIPTLEKTPSRLSLDEMLMMTERKMRESLCSTDISLADDSHELEYSTANMIEIPIGESYDRSTSRKPGGSPKLLGDVRQDSKVKFNLPDISITDAEEEFKKRKPRKHRKKIWKWRNRYNTDSTTQESDTGDDYYTWEDISKSETTSPILTKQVSLPPPCMFNKKYNSKKKRRKFLRLSSSDSLLFRLKSINKKYSSNPSSPQLSETDESSNFSTPRGSALNSPTGSLLGRLLGNSNMPTNESSSSISSKNSGTSIDIPVLMTPVTQKTKDNQGPPTITLEIPDLGDDIRFLSPIKEMPTPIMTPVPETPKLHRQTAFKNDSLSSTSTEEDKGLVTPQHTSRSPRNSCATLSIPSILLPPQEIKSITENPTKETLYSPRSSVRKKKPLQIPDISIDQVSESDNSIHLTQAFFPADPPSPSNRIIPVLHVTETTLDTDPLDIYNTSVYNIGNYTTNDINKSPEALVKLDSCISPDLKPPQSSSPFSSPEFKPPLSPLNSRRFSWNEPGKKFIKRNDSSQSIDHPTPMITVTMNPSELESDTDSPVTTNKPHMCYLSPFPGAMRTTSESNLSSSGYCSTASPSTSRRGSMNIHSEAEMCPSRRGSMNTHSETEMDTVWMPKCPSPSYLHKHAPVVFSAKRSDGTFTQKCQFMARRRVLSNKYMLRSDSEHTDDGTSPSYTIRHAEILQESPDENEVIVLSLQPPPVSKNGQKLKQKEEEVRTFRVPEIVIDSCDTTFSDDEDTDNEIRKLFVGSRKCSDSSISESTGRESPQSNCLISCPDSDGHYETRTSEAVFSDSPRTPKKQGKRRGRRVRCVSKHVAETSDTVSQLDIPCPQEKSKKRIRSKERRRTDAMKFIIATSSSTESLTSSSP